MNAPETASADYLDSRRNRIDFWNKLLAIALCVMLIMCTTRTSAHAVRAVATAIALVSGVMLLSARQLAFPRFRALYIAVGAVAAATVVSAAFSAAPRYSFKTLIQAHLWFWMVFLLIAAWATSRERQTTILRGLVFAGFISAFVGIVLFYIGGRFQRMGWIKDATDFVYVPADARIATFSNVRAKGLMQSYTRSAMVMMVTIPATVALIMSAARLGRRREALLATTTLPFAAWYLILTQARGAWAGVGLGSALVFIMMRGRIWVMGIAALLAIAAVAALPGPRNRALTLVRDASTPDLLMSGRLALWQQGIPPIRDNLVTGLGYGGNIFLQREVLAKYQLKTDRRQPDLHSMYLQTLAEVGILGLGAYALLAGVLLAISIQVWRTTSFSDIPGSAVGIALLVQIVLLGIGYYFNEAPIAHLFWSVLGLVPAGLAAKGGSRTG